MNRATEPTMNKVDTYEQRIRNIFPELSISKLSLNDKGLNNDVIAVNDELIFRFPKHERAVEKLSKESKILNLIKDYISLDIPKIFYHNREVIGYFMICGIPLSKDILRKELDKRTLQLAAKQLATFLKELHSVPKQNILDSDIPHSEIPIKHEDWLDLYQRLQDEIFPRFSSSTQLWAKKHFESFLQDKSNFDYEPKLIHGGLGGEHILFNKKNKRVSGIIDFGTAGLGDPAMDVAVLIYNYGEDFLSYAYQTYPELSSYLKRAKFYIELFDLPEVFSGIKRQNITWFLEDREPDRN
jgi:aminoglycoside 2''-phosphotransferase